MSSPVLQTHPLGFQWPTLDPFLFCVHHDDAYPQGNADFGPAASLDGRDIGSDFAGKDGWRMYHGDVVPGFPQHPHRGFETVTLVRRGYIDHSDSLGAIARFGQGDAQWLTAGRGIVHCEMFPLLQQQETNPVELFQIWLNLPRASKMAEPHFSMLWAESQPRKILVDEAGKRSEVVVVAGRFDDATPLPPPPDSWAARAEADVAIWSLRLEPGARCTLPAAASEETLRTLYFFAGDRLQVADRSLDSHVAALVKSDVALELRAGDTACEVLVLQGRPIGEPVVQHGPFVMNTRGEIQTAIGDYQRTRFGGWPWSSDGPVHGAEVRRFAERDGVRELPPATEG